MFIPYEIETLKQDTPWANWLIIAICCAVHFAFDLDDLYPYVSDGFSFPGMFTSAFIHLDFFHLAGNMIFLWVFGNAICTNIGNLRYLITYIACILISDIIHVVMDGAPAVGASGAINGIVGIVLAMYPLNRVYMFFLIFVYGKSITAKAWVIILFWLAFDIWGASTNSGGVAYWAHIGGFIGGLSFGLLALKLSWFQLTECDNRSLLEIIYREYPD